MSLRFSSSLSPPSTSLSCLLPRHVSLSLPPLHRPFPRIPRLHVLYPYPPYPPTSAAAPPPSGRGFSAAGAVLLQDAGATAAVLAGAYGLVRTFDTLTQRKLIHQVHNVDNPTISEVEQKASPYLVRIAFCHFLVHFQSSTSTEARYFASLVPLTNCLRLVIHGLSLANDEGLIKSVTREGTPEELLRGPLYYVLILILCALVFWRDSPVGVVSLAMMCGGDGVADIMGRRFGSTKLPFNQQKSWAGSISMFVFGFLVSMGMLSYFSALGYFQLDWGPTMQRVALVALVATIVESLPITEVVDDNISVPLVSMLAAYLSFGY